MNILSTQYTLKFKSLDIYVSGCNGVNGVHCVGCHNSKSWDFNQGELYDKNYLKKIEQKINDFDSIIDNIMIFGGEPLDQHHVEFINLLKNLNGFNKKIWLFTRYDLSNVPLDILPLCDYIKCGSYKEELTTDNNIQYGIKLATSNQNIYKVK